jgi:hypothetical protein
MGDVEKAFSREEGVEGVLRSVRPGANWRSWGSGGIINNLTYQMIKEEARTSTPSQIISRTLPRQRIIPNPLEILPRLTWGAIIHLCSGIQVNKVTPKKKRRE